MARMFSEEDFTAVKIMQKLLELQNSMFATFENVNDKLRLMQEDINQKFDIIDENTRRISKNLSVIYEVISQKSLVVAGEKRKQVIQDKPKEPDNSAHAKGATFSDYVNSFTTLGPRFQHQNKPHTTDIDEDIKENRPRRQICSEFENLEIQPTKALPKLRDPGSCVNVMPLEVAKQLGFPDIRPSNLSLTFGDSSTKLSSGEVRNAIVQVGECLIPVDFHVLDISIKKQKPLVFGRPFLATVGAMIDLPNKRICFTKINPNTFYPATPTNYSLNLSLQVVDEHKTTPGVDEKKPQNVLQEDEQKPEKPPKPSNARKMFSGADMQPEHERAYHLIIEVSDKSIQGEKGVDKSFKEIQQSDPPEPPKPANSANAAEKLAEEVQASLVLNPQVAEPAQTPKKKKKKRNKITKVFVQVPDFYRYNSEAKIQRSLDEAARYYPGAKLIVAFMQGMADPYPNWIDKDNATTGEEETDPSPPLSLA